MIIQDAELEYDPAEYPRLLKPIAGGVADVVYGSPFLGGPHRALYSWHYTANRFLTLLANMFTNLNLTDMKTCYKVFRREILQGLQLRQDSFGIELELTAKVAKGKWRIYEVPISFYSRTYEEGKSQLQGRSKGGPLHSSLQPVLVVTDSSPNPHYARTTCCDRTGMFGSHFRLRFVSPPCKD